MGRKAILIVNRHARQGLVDLGEGVALLQEKNWEIRRFSCEDSGRIPDLIRQHGPAADCVIIGGGDGTLNLAAEALVEIKRPLGVIPLGTANDFARTMFIPADIAEACRIIRDGRLHRVDLGQVNQKYFFNVAHIGLGEKVVRGISDKTKKRWGILAYLISFFVAFKANRRFTVHLNCDGRQEDFSSIHIAVGKGRHYGGGMTIAENAEIDDHVLNFFSLRPQSLTEVATLALSLYQGKVYDEDRIVFRTGSEMDIKTDRPKQVDTDGELTARTPARFKVAREALAVFVAENFYQRKNSDAAK